MRTQEEEADFALVTTVAQRCGERDERRDPPSEPERLAHAVYWLALEVGNGGFHQYFFNSAGAGWSAARDGLDAIGAHGAKAVLDRVLDLFERPPYDNRKSRFHQLERLEARHPGALSRADRDWSALYRPEPLEPRLAEYLRARIHELCVPPLYASGADVRVEAELTPEHFAAQPVWVRAGLLDRVYGWPDALPASLDQVKVLGASRARERSPFLVRTRFALPSGDELDGYLTPRDYVTGLAGQDALDARPHVWLEELGFVSFWIGTREDLAAPHQALLTALGPQPFPIVATPDPDAWRPCHQLRVDGFYRRGLNGQPSRLPYP